MEQHQRNAGQSLGEIVRKLIREVEQPNSSSCPVCALTITKQPHQRTQELIRATKTALLLFECQRDTAPTPAAAALIEQSEARDPDLVGEADNLVSASLQELRNALVVAGLASRAREQRGCVHDRRK